MGVLFWEIMHWGIRIFESLSHLGSEILTSWRIINRQLFLSCYRIWCWKGVQKFWILLEPWTDSRFCPVRCWGSEILSAFRIIDCFALISCGLRDKNFWMSWSLGGSEILNSFKNIVLIFYALGDQKIWISHRRKARLVYSVFHMKLYILVKWDVLSLVDLTEQFLFSFQLAKIFGNTTFVSIKYQCSLEFFQIEMPHFSLEGVTSFVFIRVRVWYQHRFAMM